VVSYQPNIFHICEKEILKKQQKMNVGAESKIVFKRLFSPIHFIVESYPIMFFFFFSKQLWMWIIVYWIRTASSIHYCSLYNCNCTKHDNTSFKLHMSLAFPARENVWNFIMFHENIFHILFKRLKYPLNIHTSVRMKN
jgi:hypothetical protein